MAAWGLSLSFPVACNANLFERWRRPTPLEQTPQYLIYIQTAYREGINLPLQVPLHRQTARVPSGCVGRLGPVNL
jgi:hypothetical protein